MSSTAILQRSRRADVKFAGKRILYVAYPLATVSDESCGGAEQILFMLEREIAIRHHRTTVSACTGSRVTGELLETGSAATQFEQLAERDDEHNRAILNAIAHREMSGEPFDLLHDHSGRFWNACLVDIPVLVTLHLSRNSYPPEMFADVPENVFLNCVSARETEQFADLPNMLGFVRNGVPLDRFPFSGKKEDYLVCLGRICEEKATHLAMDAAEQAGARLILMGPGYLYARDQEYFDQEIAPRLERNPRTLFVPSPSFSTKVELLRSARGLLMPSQLEETSSLVSIEAMACGTPAIAFRTGALPEVVLHDETGFIVDTVSEMADAVRMLASIDPAVCRRHVEIHHSAARMADEYELLYRTILEGRGEANLIAFGRRLTPA